MKLAAGLGNPGKKYALTRHNLGFLLIDKFAAAYARPINQRKFQSLCAEFVLNDEKIILLKPQTFMNNSGEALRAALNFYKLSAPDFIILCDDLDQDFGAARFRAKGSAGGHNGLKSIIANLGFENFARIKMGIGHPAPQGKLSNGIGHPVPQRKLSNGIGHPAPPAKEQVTDYVLGKFSAAEQKQLPAILDKGLALLNKWLSGSWSKNV
ncbi:MAG: aminoacyl-tRNA hydrolase [Candidatus Margulisbacteria bacterium]|jgi:PTH1 family peptidyl-tRNA hydrolase|nr:aminoacyl-tRNA hydrolase [Candidatus Margulisiibacteriota bacterium]